MGLNDTPSGERVHIAIFGKRNAGKSSLINAITGQELAIVSKVPGTTTDPVYKAMELLPLGPVMLIDTPGLDDEGELGGQRVKRAMSVLNKTDIGIMVVDAGEYLKFFMTEITRNSEGLKEGYLDPVEKQIMNEIKKRDIPFFIVLNKIDLLEEGGHFSKLGQSVSKILSDDFLIPVSAKRKQGIETLKEHLAKQIKKNEGFSVIVGDLLEPEDMAVLVVSIDHSSPKGRLILPQQQTIRDVLDANGLAVVVKDTELAQALQGFVKKPKIVITDSQVFSKVAKEVPENILLTSFSILFAKYKGELEELVKGVGKVEDLKDHDIILMGEGCTHHRQCEDIGTVKIPGWLLKKTGKELIFETSSGPNFPSDLKKYAFIVHCGGCMLNKREMRYRIKAAREQGIPIVNYGILIAYLNGILDRCLEPFPDFLEKLKKI